jgi:hypothetical protein
MVEMCLVVMGVNACATGLLLLLLLLLMMMMMMMALLALLALLGA